MNRTTKVLRDLLLGTPMHLGFLSLHHITLNLGKHLYATRAVYQAQQN